MAPVALIRTRLRDTLIRRRTISIDLPEFAIRALQYRADLANEANEGDEEPVTLNDVIEWYVLSPLSVKEMPVLEEAVPGFTAALTTWLFQSTYSPGE
jgi:hypothetical protein